jgi:hypothetical protein
MSELSQQIRDEIDRLAAAGDALAKDLNYTEALLEYNKAWKLIPSPKNVWEISTRVTVAVADACFLSGQFKRGSDALAYSMTCPGAIGNPFIHLRFGQCQYELGNLDAAADELARAYMGAGSEIFSEDDPKYFEFLKTRIRPPESGAW